MDDLELNLLETHNLPTFFRTCNRTYFVQAAYVCDYLTNVCLKRDLWNRVSKCLGTSGTRRTLSVAPMDSSPSVSRRAQSSNASWISFLVIKQFESFPAINLCFFLSGNVTGSNGKDYWTSGTSEGVLSADHPMWCATNQFLDPSVWDEPSGLLILPLLNRYLALEFELRSNFIPVIKNQKDIRSLFILCENNHLNWYNELLK
jgi:hypothetical protein